MDATRPFALLWDRERQAARLFCDAAATVEAHVPADVLPALDRLRALARAGHWLAGGLSYEAGLALEPKLASLAVSGELLWFGAFGPPQMLGANAIDALLEEFGSSSAIGALQPQADAATYAASVAQLQALILAGDIYQANLTFPAHIATSGHPIALFRTLFSPAAAPHAALVHLGGGRWWLSLSPELFFTLENGALTCRPMKGTARRAADSAADLKAAAALAADPKNRAENLMITDLIRNDLARVALPGTVRVPQLFQVETYPSLHQMTSTVTAQLAPDRDALDALAALFPCGSITGAPKIRAMQVIADLEARPRGIYCGSIGWIGPRAASAGFNVAIRTLAIAPDRPALARLGLGAGIVADSAAPAEWEECLLKGRFLHARGPLSLLETMRRHPDGSVPLLEHHLDRMQRSAAWFAIPFDRGEARHCILRLPPAGTDQRLRLLLSAHGALAVQAGPPPPLPRRPLRVVLLPLPVPETDWRLHHKTSDRRFYDDARRAGGADEVLFIRADGSLTEGSFTSLFVPRGGQLLTPFGPGLLPGVLQASLLATGQAKQGRLTPADLAGGFQLGNALRGLLPAVLA